MLRTYATAMPGITLLAENHIRTNSTGCNVRYNVVMNTITNMTEPLFPCTNALQTPNPPFWTTKTVVPKTGGSTPSLCLDKAVHAPGGGVREQMHTYSRWAGGGTGGGKFSWQVKLGVGQKMTSPFLGSKLMNLLVFFLDFEPKKCFRVPKPWGLYGPSFFFRCEILIFSTYLIF